MNKNNAVFDREEEELEKRIANTPLVNSKGKKVDNKKIPGTNSPGSGSTSKQMQSMNQNMANF